MVEENEELFYYDLIDVWFAGELVAQPRTNFFSWLARNLVGWAFVEKFISNN